MSGEYTSNLELKRAWDASDSASAANKIAAERYARAVFHKDGRKRKALGDDQQAVMNAISRPGSGSYPGAGWRYGSHSLTVRVLNTLVRRGLVWRWAMPYHPFHNSDRVIYDDVYTLPDRTPGLAEHYSAGPPILTWPVGDRRFPDGLQSLKGGDNG